MPTKEDILDVYKPLPKKNDKTFQGRHDIKLWYFDIWLPSLSSKFDDQRFYNLATMTTDVDGKQVPFVTIELEAFGITALTNFNTKWTAIASKKAEHGQAWKAPPRSTSPQCHDTLWSSGSTGKSNNGLGGWSQDAYKDWFSNQGAIDTIRKEDGAKDWYLYKVGRHLMRKHHKIEEQQPPPKKKRKGNDEALAEHTEEAAAAPVRPKLSNIVFKDDEEDTFSLHSECSSGEQADGGAQVDVTATNEDGKAVAATIA